MNEFPERKSKPQRMPPGGGTEIAVDREDAPDALVPAQASTRVWMIVFIAVLARLALMTIGHTYKFSPRDDHFGFGWETGRIARAIALGQGFSNPFHGITGPTAWIAPLYPYFLAGVFKIFGVYSNASAWIALAVNSVFSALTCYTIYHIGREVFGTRSRVPVWAAWIWALVPSQMFWAIRFAWETSLSAYLLSVVVLLMLRHERDARLLHWIEFGALWAIIALSSPALLSLLPFFGIWWLLRQPNRAVAVRHAAISALLFIAINVPWTLRNHETFGKPVFIRGNFGAEFRMGNGPGAEGYWMFWQHPTQDPTEFAKYHRMGEAEYVTQRKQQAMQWIRENPKKFAQITLKRVLLFWAGIPRSEVIAGFDIRDLSEAAFFCSSALSFVGLFLMLRHRLRGSFIFAVSLLVYPMIYYLTFAHERYRHPIEPMMVLLAVYPVAEALRNRTGKKAATTIA
jgi:4-amino-4-deoxy-L-arabinose transferase-like glycosyltransferase